MLKNHKWIVLMLKINLTILMIACWSVVFYYMHWNELLQTITDYLIEAVPTILGSMLGLGLGIGIKKGK